MGTSDRCKIYNRALPELHSQIISRFCKHNTVFAIADLGAERGVACTSQGSEIL